MITPISNLTLSSCFHYGQHMGHAGVAVTQRQFWHPLMRQYLLGIREGVAVFDHQTQRQAMCRAFYVLALILKAGGHVLVVNTHPEFSKMCRNWSHLTLGGNQYTASQYVTPRISYCTSTWIGGLLTNWRQTSRSVLTFARFAERCGDFVTRHNIDFPRYRKVKKCFQGLLSRHSGSVELAFYDKPDILFVINPNENRGVIREAHRLHIPVIALAESNTDLRGIEYPIPGNTASMTFVYYCLKKLVAVAHVDTTRK